jgi:hypothetical protein
MKQTWIPVSCMLCIFQPHFWVMNGFGLEANSVNRVSRVSDSKKISLQSKSLHTDYEQLKRGILIFIFIFWVIFAFRLFSNLWRMSSVRGIRYDFTMRRTCFNPVHSIFSGSYNVALWTDCVTSKHWYLFIAAWAIFQLSGGCHHYR